MKNLVHLLIKSIIISACIIFITCKNSSEFEEKLLEDKGAWNTFVIQKNDNIITYEDLKVFKNDKSWEGYMRSSPHSKKIFKPIYIDEVKGISKWRFNKKDSIFILSGEKKYRLQEIKNDTIFLEPLFNKEVNVIYIKDKLVIIPEDY